MTKLIMRGLHDLATLEKIAAQYGDARCEALANCLAALQGQVTGAGPGSEELVAAWLRGAARGRDSEKAPELAPKLEQVSGGRRSQGAAADRPRQLPREN